MTCQSDVIFLRKNEVSIYTFKCSGIMENWLKHELFHLNNEISWWHDMTHDNMSLRDIRHVSRHDLIHIKFGIWLPLYVCRCEWTGFYFCFAQYLGREIHSNYRRLGDLHACIHAWLWNWRSRHVPMRFYACVIFDAIIRSEKTQTHPIWIYPKGFVWDACVKSHAFYARDLNGPTE